MSPITEAALQRVVAARGDQIAIVEIDAPNEPDLTQRYRVLTVPTTVVLDATGRAHAVNYGLANTQKLLTQIDELFIPSPRTGRDFPLPC